LGETFALYARDNIVRALTDETPFTVLGTGKQTRDVTYVADGVAATIAAMEKGPPGAVYNVGGGTETTLNGVIALCGMEPARGPRGRPPRTARVGGLDVERARLLRLTEPAESQILTKRSWFALDPSWARCRGTVFRVGGCERQ
jgi:nucleoside-diphosphate-sugar epimerase